MYKKTGHMSIASTAPLIRTLDCCGTICHYWLPKFLL